MGDDMMGMPPSAEMAPPIDEPMDEPMGEPMNEPMGEPQMENGDDELVSLINKLSIEDKAAVTKYAKSMVDDADGTEGEGGDDGMPMESRKPMSNMVDEALDDILNDKRDPKRLDKKLPKAYRNKQTPFKSPY